MITKRKLVYVPHITEENGIIGKFKIGLGIMSIPGKDGKNLLIVLSEDNPLPLRGQFFPSFVLSRLLTSLKTFSTVNSLFILEYSEPSISYFPIMKAN